MVLQFCEKLQLSIKALLKIRNFKAKVIKTKRKAGEKIKTFKTRDDKQGFPCDKLSKDEDRVVKYSS